VERRRRGLLNQSLERFDIQAVCSIDVPAQRTAIDANPFPNSGRRQRGSDVAQGTAQRAECFRLGAIGPEGEGDPLARQRRPAVQQQVGQQAPGARSQRGSNRGRIV
jgi:hypothetical protein